MTGIYKRKVARIKKSVYVNIPSKISKAIGIVKGSVLYVTIEEGRVILSKNQDETGAIKNQAPTLESEYRPNKETKSGDGSLKRLLEEGYTW